MIVLASRASRKAVRQSISEQLDPSRSSSVWKKVKGLSDAMKTMTNKSPAIPASSLFRCLAPLACLFFALVPSQHVLGQETWGAASGFDGHSSASTWGTRSTVVRTQPASASNWSAGKQGIHTGAQPGGVWRESSGLSTGAKPPAGLAAQRASSFTAVKPLASISQKPQSGNKSLQQSAAGVKRPTSSLSQLSKNVHKSPIGKSSSSQSRSSSTMASWGAPSNQSSGSGSSGHDQSPSNPFTDMLPGVPDLGSPIESQP